MVLKKQKSKLKRKQKGGEVDTKSMSANMMGAMTPAMMEAMPASMLGAMTPSMMGSMPTVIPTVMKGGKKSSSCKSSSKSKQSKSRKTKSHKKPRKLTKKNRKH